MKKRIETFITYAKRWRRAVSLTPVVIEKMRIVYYPIPKIASSSIKSYFLTHAITGAKGAESENHIHNNVHQDSYPTLPVSKARRLVGYTSFVVVRHPIERIWSCYKDKIVRYKKNGMPLRPAFERYNIIFGKQFFDLEMSFEAFVHSVSRIPDWASDQHFRSQHCYVNVQKGKIAVDRIVRLENLDSEMRDLTKQLGLPPWDLRKLNESGSSHQPMEIAANIKDKIYQRYRRDFELCGYSYEPSSPTMQPQ